MAVPVVIKILTDQNSFNSDLNTTESRFTQFGDKMANIGSKMTIAITAPLIAFGKSAIDAASAMNEMEDLTRDAFGKNAQAIIDWSETLIQQFGVGKDEALDFASKTKLMFDSWNVPAAESEEIIMNLVMRAGDLASAFDTDVSDATEAMGAAFRGEFDTLEKFGISLRASEVQTRALEIATADGREEFTRADEALAIYQLIMERSEGVAGNFARTQDSVANQTRIAKERFEELQRELGTHLLPIMGDLLEIVIEFLERFRDLPPETQKTILAFGAASAAAGPLLVVLGNIVKALPLLSSGLGLIVGHPVIAALAAIAAGLVYAYQNSESFRKVVNSLIDVLKTLGGYLVDAFKDASPVIKALVNFTIEGVRAMTNVFLDFAESLLLTMAAVADALGMDALAEKLRNAADNVGQFKDDVNDKLDQVKKNVDIMFKGIDEVTPTIEQIRTEIRSLQDEIYATYDQEPDLVHPEDPRISGPGLTTGGISPYDIGGVVDGPIGSPQLIMAHGGETMVPTHKPGVSLEGVAMNLLKTMQPNVSSKSNNFGPINVLSNDPDDMAYQLVERERLTNLISSE